ncbi:MAG: hypothetical protein GXP25_03335 [Planctomycetes bacterium]|nr:hypothetical protein [Planctomycetota bacterium]
MKRAACIATIAILLMGLIAYVVIDHLRPSLPPPTAQESSQGTPLHLAIQKYRYACDAEEQRGAEEIIMSLIAAGADPNAKDEGNLFDTPLHMALGGGYSPFPISRNMGDGGLPRIVRRLIEAGADVNAKNKLGFTPFHYAVQGYPVELVGFMIAKGADVNVQCPEGWSPLHCAVSAKAGQVVDLLIRSGADVNARLKDGTTPLDLAEANGYKEIADLLRGHGAEAGKQPAD